jgi:type VI secretion system protein ImpH
MEAAGMSVVATIELETDRTVAPAPPVAPVEGWTSPVPDADAFDLVPLVRLLERLHPDRARAGEGSAPSQEVVRLKVPPSIAFPPGEVRSVEREDSRAPYDVTVHLPALIGPMATVPWHYTEEVRDRSAAGDDAMRDFLDLLHHRTLSLFVRAASLPQPSGDTRDLLGRMMFSLIGEDAAAPRMRAHVPDEAMLSYAGLLVPHRRSAVGLEQCLSDYFDVPVTVRQFSGGHYAIAQQERTAMRPDALDNDARLGAGALIGDVVFDPQAQVTIDVGPVDLESYHRFLPGGDAAASLAQLVRSYCDEAVEAAVHLVLAKESVPGVVLDGDDQTVRLGWTTWITTRTRSADAVDVTVPLAELERGSVS